MANRDRSNWFPEVSAPWQVMLASVLVVIGLGWSLFASYRGAESVRRLRSPGYVAHGQRALDHDVCVGRAIKRLVPAGSAVWAVPDPDYFWSFSLGPMSTPEHRVVSTPSRGTYALQVFTVGQRHGPGVRCGDVVLVVRKL